MTCRDIAAGTSVCGSLLTDAKYYRQQSTKSKLLEERFVRWEMCLVKGTPVVKWGRIED